MFVAGFVVFLSTFMPERTATVVACTLPMVMLAAWLFMMLTEKVEGDLPVTLPECPLRNISPFFRRRFDFIRRGQHLTGESIYRFKLLRNTVVVASGAPGRRDFFTSRSLDLGAGFKVLSGIIPTLPGVTTDLEPGKIATIHKRLASLQNSANLEQLIPRILEDVRQVIDGWGPSGTISPFDEIPKVSFQTNLRCLAPSELADDPVVAARLRTLYDTLESSTTPASVLFPWFPTPSVVRKIISTKRIYDTISAAVDARIRGHVLPQDDPLQPMLDNRDDRAVIIGFIMGLLVAGARSTGTTASWFITFLASHPTWKDKAMTEIRGLLASHSDTHGTPHIPSTTGTDPSPAALSLASLSGALSSIPLNAWETQTPTLDAIIRETLRLAQPHTALRQNTSPSPVLLAGKAVPPGAFAVYPFADVHLSAELYPDPWRFDPARPQSKMPFVWVGWGAGASVCLGQRLARLQLKLVAATVLMGFEIEVVGEDGRVLTEVQMPRPDWNDALHCRPAGECALRYRRVDS
ncbi:cytochrome P450 [Rhodofomes roseus]|uniref:Cytochrome P450 n=1 Tax=Rhodofomes roseus TaxID=34475 RepID=A0ABQ8K7R2_9APHY|nr:cytochrome P450 [Rhodofomes roseus]KAH9833322.1 cytochrome P450 [Rhodofomes roseus]